MKDCASRGSQLTRQLLLRTGAFEEHIELELPFEHLLDRIQRATSEDLVRKLKDEGRVWWWSGRILVRCNSLLGMVDDTLQNVFWMTSVYA